MSNLIPNGIVTTGGGSWSVDCPVATGATVVFEVYSAIRIIQATLSGPAVGDSWASKRTWVFSNVAGTVHQVGLLVDSFIANDGSLASCQTTASVSGTTITFSCQVAASGFTQALVLVNVDQTKYSALRVPQ